jgi:hypothetical protein
MELHFGRVELKVQDPIRQVIAPEQVVKDAMVQNDQQQPADYRDRDIPPHSQNF